MSKLQKYWGIILISSAVIIGHKSINDLDVKLAIKQHHITPKMYECLEFHMYGVSMTNEKWGQHWVFWSPIPEDPCTCVLDRKDGHVLFSLPPSFWGDEGNMSCFPPVYYAVPK